jgi:hypothetical protein
MDDVGLEHSGLAYHLKIWSDRYGCTGETKGGMIPLKYILIIVTSQYSPDQIWRDRIEDLEAIERRFKITHIT